MFVKRMWKFGVIQKVDHNTPKQIILLIDLILGNHVSSESIKRAIFYRIFRKNMSKNLLKGEKENTNMGFIL